MKEERAFQTRRRVLSLRLYCSYVLLLFLVTLGAHPTTTTTHAQTSSSGTTPLLFHEAKFNELIQKLESDVLAFAAQLETVYDAARCRHDLNASCARQHYDDCTSTLYPSPVCLAAYHIPVCGADPCSGLIDPTISTVRLPAAIMGTNNNNPTAPQVMETVCYTRLAMDAWLQAKRSADAAYWRTVGVEPFAWYFGSHTGVFRVWPARQSDACGVYDPRVRPWYVAASSGPKNVLMVLDTSGSMRGLRMTLLQEAAKRVVNTLTVSDRIAIIPFSTTAKEPITTASGAMFAATQENKNILLAAIDQLHANGRTNIYDAFETAFDVLDQSARDEYTVNCHTAILFLTDGEMTEPDNVTEDDVVELVRTRLENTQRQWLDKPILLFTYSVSESQQQEEQVHQLPSKLACATEWGVWSKVTADANIVDSLSSYYRLFALGLGSAPKNVVAWVEPYKYEPGETYGTSVSVPVYDRSKSPPLFLGVAAIDVSLAALDAALGIEPGRGSEESINRVALVSTARCPALSLTLCELESFRKQASAGGEAGLCAPQNCTEADYVQVEETKCPNVTDYPTDLWVSVENAGLSYEERVCCVVGETSPSDMCPAPAQEARGVSTVVWVGALIGSTVFCLGLCAWCLVPVEDKENDDDTVKAASNALAAPPIIVTALSQPPVAVTIESNSSVGGMYEPEEPKGVNN